MTKALEYCKIHGLPIDLAGLLQYINEKYWFLFHAKNLVLMNPRIITLSCGYYEGTGAHTKKVDLTYMITTACFKAHYKYRKFNDAPKGGVLGNKVSIYF